MKQFLDQNFLLQTASAERLYHEYASQMPIIDYHCHISPQEIAEDKIFDNMTAIWLAGDHYKWRGMRTNGIAEKYITGDASDWEKFEKWAETVPYTLRNPLFHWTHLELKNTFGVNQLLNKESAKAIWEKCNTMLQTSEFSCCNLIRKANVEVVGTTDDPIDSLEHHKKIATDGFATKVLPSWRPDKAMMVNDVVAYNDYLDKLSTVSEIEITDFKSMVDALQKRHDFFHEMGCRVSDHGLERFHADNYTQAEIDAIFLKIRAGKDLNEQEIEQFKSAMLVLFAHMDHSKGWTQQYHVGVIRNNNTRMFKQVGPDTGFDSIADELVAVSMSKFFNKLASTNQLTKTILYNLNPSHNEVYATMIGNFQDGSIAGKIQFGSGWWFLDQKDGMERQMNALSSLGLLSRFVGMLTDSRSFLSYSRHEYFRRILCNLLGNDMENGLIPADFDWVGKMVQDISYNNAKDYFKF